MMAFVTFSFFKNIQNDRNTIHKNLVLCLLIAEIIFLAGISQTAKTVSAYVCVCGGGGVGWGKSPLITKINFLACVSQKAKTVSVGMVSGLELGKGQKRNSSK